MQASLFRKEVVPFLLIFAVLIAATIILDGVKKDHWRILVGKDAEALDRAVRKSPLHTYDLDFNRYMMAEWQD